nr:hypothetical protein CFP56_63058 [Quercus suber]
MSFFRSTRSLLPVTRRRLALPIQQQRFATQDYGSGAGNPAGEKPQDQGKSQISRDLEHPGPEAPSTGQKGSSSSSNGNGNQGQKDEQIKTKSNRQQEQEQLAEKNKQGSDGKGGPQPKILNDAPPKEGEGSAEVQKHNKEMDQRAAESDGNVRDQDTQKDKVGKQFWKGTGGVDKDP